MESRCYHGGDGRTKMKILKLGKIDLTTLISCVVFLGVFIVLNTVIPPIVR